MWEMFLKLCVQPLGVLERQYNIIKNTNSGGICLLANSPSLHGSVTWDEVTLWASASTSVEWEQD